MFSFASFSGVLVMAMIIYIVVLITKYVVCDYFQYRFSSLKSWKKRKECGLTRKLELEMVENNIYWRRDYKDFSISYFNRDMGDTEKNLKVFRYDLDFLTEQVRMLKEQYDFSSDDRLMRLFGQANSFLDQMANVLETNGRSAAVFALARETFQSFPSFFRDFKRAAAKCVEAQLDQDYEDTVKVASFEIAQIQTIFDGYLAHALS